MDFLLTNTAETPEMSIHSFVNQVSRCNPYEMLEPEEFISMDDYTDSKNYYSSKDYDDKYISRENQLNELEEKCKYIDISDWEGISPILYIVKNEMNKMGLLGRMNDEQIVILYDKSYNNGDAIALYISSYVEVYPDDYRKTNIVAISSREVTDLIKNGVTCELTLTKSIIGSLAHELCHSLQDLTNYTECNKLGYWLNPFETEARDIGHKVSGLFEKFINGEYNKNDDEYNEMYDLMFRKLLETEKIVIS